METYEDFLEHFGIKGMKWGVRKDKYSTTEHIVTNSPPKKGEMRMNKNGQLSFVIDAKPLSTKDTSVIEKALGRKLKSFEKAYSMTTQTREQYEAWQQHKRKRNTAIKVGVVGGAIAARYAARAALGVSYPGGDRMIMASDMQNEEYDKFLEHFGIKGMKWGVRRQNPSGGGLSSLDTSSDDAKRAAQTYKMVKAHGTASVSNDDLNALVNRMRLEQSYSQLTSQKKQDNEASKFFKSILKDIAKKQITNLGNEAASKQIAVALGSKKGRHRKK